MKTYKILLVLILIFYYDILPAQINDSVNISSSEFIEYKRLKRKLHYSFADSVTLKLSFIGYACGDCYPQYKVEKNLVTIYGEGRQYYNKEIHLECISESLKKQFEYIKLSKCSKLCYSYTLSGVLKRNGFGVFKLEAYSGFIKQKGKCCRKKR